MSGGESVKATGKLTADDVMAGLAVASNSSYWRASIFFIAIALVVCGVGLIWSGPHGRLLWAILLAVGILLALLYPSFVRSSIAKTLSSSLEFRNQMTWTFTSESLLIDAMGATHLHAWSSFMHAKITKELLLLAKPGKTVVLVVPRRCFASDADWQFVVRLLSAKMPVQPSPVDSF